MGTASQHVVQRKRVFVRGVVQGVGFRPFVYNLAKSLGLAGWVLNSSSGVYVEVEGGEEALERFVERLVSSPPPLARIEEFSVTEAEPEQTTGFVIRESVAREGEFVLVSPDVATCPECWRDFTDPANRRFAYPFTNCTNCGPRYTIIQDIPYDRPATTMSPFHMCPECQAEYDDPGDRRFHAQPNACPRCGPSLALAGRGPAAVKYPPGTSLEVIRALRRELREGKIVALKGLGGFHLACDATNDAAVRELRRRKRRSDKPFALMSRDVESVELYCEVDQAERALLSGIRRPIVILPRKPGSAVSLEVAPGNRTLGVMLPYTPLHFLLFGDSPDQPPEFTALVMTSGNISEEPIVTSNEEAAERLGDIADRFAYHNRGIYMRTDDSVARVFEEKERLLRRSRGYVPTPIDLRFPMTELLAVGGELKNTFCLTTDRYAILSQHIGDLENYETLRFFEETLANLTRLYRVTPRAVAYDLHPGYLSSKYALGLDLPRVGVQHHHAHVAACMAENGVHDKVIGVSFDGTGYGTDGQIWGGEFLVADFAGFERRAHLRYVPLPGGDAAIRQPWRVALSYLHETFGALPSDLPLFRQVPEKHMVIVDKMLRSRTNTVMTSSCGRLYDAVASITGLRHEVNFEGQAAIELEMAADPGVDGQYGFEIARSSEALEVDLRPAVAEIVRDVQRGRRTGEISARFHNTLAALIEDVCVRISADGGLRRVALSGGTFQNFTLLRKTVPRLRRAGFEVLLHVQVPPNDGGLALGQAVIANQILKRS